MYILEIYTLLQIKQATCTYVQVQPIVVVANFLFVCILGYMYIARVRIWLCIHYDVPHSPSIKTMTSLYVHIFVFSLFNTMCFKVVMIINISELLALKHVFAIVILGCQNRQYCIVEDRLLQ